MLLWAVDRLCCPDLRTCHNSAHRLALSLITLARDCQLVQQRAVFA